MLRIQVVVLCTEMEGNKPSSRSPMRKNIVACLIGLSLLACAQIPGLKGLKADAIQIATESATEVKEEVTAEVKAEVKEAIKVDVVATAVAAGNFTKLAAALQAADLIEALQGPGPFTVFAPTDDAFAKLPAGALAGLLTDKAKLTKVLQAHVIAGRVVAKEVKTMKAKTLGGAEIDVVVKDGKVTFGGATVTATDIDCTNGVIHVIDTVVMPK